MPQPQPPGQERCETCRYWVRPEQAEEKITMGEGRGECHKYPPHTHLSMQAIIVVYPPTKPTGWCGEWKTAV